jgi:hypothetical protein
MHTSSKRQRVSPRAAMRFTRLRFELVLSNFRPLRILNGVPRYGSPGRCRRLNPQRERGLTSVTSGLSILSVWPQGYAARVSERDVSSSRWARQASHPFINRPRGRMKITQKRFSQRLSPFSRDLGWHAVKVGQRRESGTGTKTANTMG